MTGATVEAGEYDLSEVDGPAGYTASDWTCTGATIEGATVSVANGGDVTCTITNDDQPGTLTLVKDVVNDNGGTAEPGDWTLSAEGPTLISGATGSEAVTGATVDAGGYELSESGGPGGYVPGDWTCTGGELEGITVTVPNGGDVTCTIVNDDQPGTLTLVKAVVNDDGGSAEATDWTLSADGPTPISGATGTGAVTGVTVNAGDYDLSESGPTGYAASDWVCTGATIEGATVSVANGGDVTCTITNDDQPGTLTLVKDVVNDNGGTAEPGDWTLSAEGPTLITGATGSEAVTGATVDAGGYELSEAGGPGGYVPGDWTCTGGELEGITVTVPNGGDVTCTITNDDQPGTLTLVKEVVNDDGGSAEATEWTLSADGPTPISGATGSDAVTGATVEAGEYDLSEVDGPAGYAASDWTCTGATVTGATVAVPNGADVTCTITNDDQPGTLTLRKQVETGATGATDVPADWTLTADGPTPISGASGSPAVSGAAVNAGTYELTEAGPGGYDAGDWSCEGAGGTLEGASLTLANGADV
ncbi:hypothetical protein KV100_19210, partial [Mumia sp. zg.B21]|nr:hypothetical protein [Mumia sp. zg.B21]